MSNYDWQKQSPTGDACMQHWDRKYRNLIRRLMASDTSAADASTIADFLHGSGLYKLSVKNRGDTTFPRFPFSM